MTRATFSGTFLLVFILAVYISAKLTAYLRN